MSSIIHVILMAQTFPTGAQIWACPECSYSIMAEFHDPYEPTTIVINQGDINVQHVAIKEGNTSTQKGRQDTYLLDIEDEDRIKYLEEQINSIFDAVNDKEEPD